MKAQAFYGKINAINNMSLASAARCEGLQRMLKAASFKFGRMAFSTTMVGSARLLLLLVFSF
jgi:hypothetical protein